MANISGKRKNTEADGRGEKRESTTNSTTQRTKACKQGEPKFY